MRHFQVAASRAITPWPRTRARRALHVPPEPIERVLDAIYDFVPGDRLKLIIDCHPVPLFRILENNGFAFREAPTESVYEIAIWLK